MTFIHVEMAWVSIPSFINMIVVKIKQSFRSPANRTIHYRAKSKKAFQKISHFPPPFFVYHAAKAALGNRRFLSAMVSMV